MYVINQNEIIQNNNIYEKFQKHINSGNLKNKVTSQTLVTLISTNPIEFYKTINNNIHINFNSIEKDIQIKIFYYACNMLKEVEKEIKILGLKIIDKIVDTIQEEYLLNAYIFEKELAKNFQSTGSGSKKKFVSVGDYELAKYDTNSGMNYGFFASVLEEEKKEVKIILTLLLD
jgi:hypothetical protein